MAIAVDQGEWLVEHRFAMGRGLAACLAFPKRGLGRHAGAGDQPVDEYAAAHIYCG
jgi:hypothetical protein